MKRCINCGHQIRRIKGIWKHRNENVGGSGGFTFNNVCHNTDFIPRTNTGDVTTIACCNCKEPKS